jgi:hypothetical protein
MDGFPVDGVFATIAILAQPMPEGRRPPHHRNSVIPIEGYAKSFDQIAALSADLAQTDSLNDLRDARNR